MGFLITTLMPVWFWVVWDWKVGYTEQGSTAIIVLFFKLSSTAIIGRCYYVRHKYHTGTNRKKDHRPQTKR